MRLYTYETRVEEAFYGAASSKDPPNETINHGGWKAIGTIRPYGKEYLILQRRRWFWERKNKNERN